MRLRACSWLALLSWCSLARHCNPGCRAHAPIGWPGWRTTDSLGFSFALSLLAALGAHYLRLEFDASLLIAAYGICAAAWALGVLRPNRHILPGTARPLWQRFSGAVAGLVFLAAAVAWRWYQARALILPAWVDSLHHTLIVKKILELGVVPAALAPEVQAPLAYHYGFHLMAALFSALGDIPPAETVLWFGQALNALIALSVYRLGKTVWGDWRQASLAALLVTFAFQMPAYYVTWGRYTLSAGLVALPLAMAAVVDCARSRISPSQVIRLALLTAAVALTHLTTLLLLDLFTAVVLLTGLFTRLPEPLTRRPAGEAQDGGGDNSVSQTPTAAGKLGWWHRLWQPTLGTLAGVLISAPWLVYIWRNQPATARISLVSPLDGGQAEYWRYILFLLGPQHNYILLGLSGAALLWAVLRPGTRAMALWALLMGFLTLPWGLRLAPFRPDHMAILLFLPAALLLAGLVVGVTDLLTRLPWDWLRCGLRAVALLAVAAGLAWGGWNTRNVINPATVFVNESDLEAAAWVATNTPPDARFLINTTHWMSGSYRGVDGGYWLSVLTGRDTLLPPALYTLGESEEVARIGEWARRASQLQTCDADFWALVQESGAQYVYVRQGQGSLQPGALAGCDRLLAVFRRGGVFIYEILSP